MTIPSPMRPITAHIFRCGRCHKPSPPKGNKARHILGVRVKICAGCAGKEPRT